MATKSVVHHLFLVGISTCALLVLTVDTYNLHNKQFQSYYRKDINRLHSAEEIGLDKKGLSEETGSYKYRSNRRSSHRIYETEELEDLEVKLSRVCGRKQSSYISGGRNAKPGEFPSFVLIINVLGGWLKSASGSCGGTILDEYHVLSAAHCFGSGGYDWLSGSVDALVDRPNNDSVVLPHKIESVCRHPDWEDGNGYSPDLAVIRLKEPFKFGPNVQSACLPVSDYAGEFGGEVIVHALGMGNILEWNSTYNVYPEKLRALPVDKDTCPAGFQSDIHMCWEWKDKNYIGGVCLGE